MQAIKAAWANIHSVSAASLCTPYLDPPPAWCCLWVSLLYSGLFTMYEQYWTISLWHLHRMQWKEKNAGATFLWGSLKFQPCSDNEMFGSARLPFSNKDVASSVTMKLKMTMDEGGGGVFWCVLRLFWSCLCSSSLREELCEAQQQHKSAFSGQI